MQISWIFNWRLFTWTARGMNTMSSKLYRLKHKVEFSIEFYCNFVWILFRSGIPLRLIRAELSVYELRNLKAGIPNDASKWYYLLFVLFIYFSATRIFFSWASFYGLIIRLLLLSIEIIFNHSVSWVLCLYVAWFD